MIPETTPGELQARLDDENVAVVDIRDPSSYADGHIDGAVNVPPNRLTPGALDAPWAQADEIVVSCYVGKSSKRVAMVLGNHLDAEISSLRGGFDAWDGPVADGRENGSTADNEGPSASVTTRNGSDAPF